MDVREQQGVLIALMDKRRKIHWPRIALGALSLLGVGIVLINHANTLPSLDNRSVSSAFADTADTHLGKAITPRTDAHPDQS